MANEYKLPLRYKVGHHLPSVPCETDDFLGLANAMSRIAVAMRKSFLLTLIKLS